MLKNSWVSADRSIALFLLGELPRQFFMKKKYIMIHVSFPGDGYPIV